MVEDRQPPILLRVLLEGFFGKVEAGKAPEGGALQQGGVGGEAGTEACQVDGGAKSGRNVHQKVHKYW